MEPKNRTLVAVATYNEIDNLPSLVDGIFQYADDVDILVVDDNSPDGTGRWCDQQRTSKPRLQCLHRPAKLGLGTATIATMQHALHHGYRFLVNMDADFSHHPQYLPELIQRMEPSDGDPPDVVIGSRYVKGGGVSGWPLHRRWMSRALNAYVRRLLGLIPNDCSGSFRCYRTSILRELDLSSFQSHGYSVYEEIIWRLQRCGARFDEMPIVFVDRERGKTKLNMAEAFRAVRVIHQIAWSKTD